MKSLEPRLVVLSGLAGTGKSTIVTEVVKELSNSFVLEKDPINQATLLVKPTSQGKLPPFETYVAEDTIFPYHARDVETPFGKMIEIDPKNEFYGRHGRDQCYMIMARIAVTNLDLGKIPIIDCFVERQIRDGSLGRFMDQPSFSVYPRYLIHVTADEDDLYQRLANRAQQDPKAAVRDEKNISSKERFHQFLTEEQQLVPQELKNYEHLLINTTRTNPQNSAKALVDYISK
jgi:predicted kinase